VLVFNKTLSLSEIQYYQNRQQARVQGINQSSNSSNVKLSLNGTSGATGNNDANTNLDTALYFNPSIISSGQLISIGGYANTFTATGATYVQNLSCVHGSGFSDGGCYYFDGTGDYISASAVVNYVASQSGMVCSWFKRGGALANGDYDMIWAMGKSTGAVFQYVGFFNNSGQMRLDGDNYPNQRWAWWYNTTNLNDGNWHHICMMSDSSKTHIFVDGVNITGSVTTVGATSNQGGWFADNSDLNRFSIGSMNYNAGGEQYIFNGFIDDVEIYNSSKTTSQIQDMYKRGAQVEPYYYNLSAISGGSGTPSYFLDIYAEGPANNSMTYNLTPPLSFNASTNQSGSISCIAYLGGVAVGSNSSVANATSTTINVNASQGFGIKNWWITCTAGTSTNTTQNMTLNISTHEPAVNPLAPADGANTTLTAPSVQFSVTDDYDSALNCSFWINSTKVAENTSVLNNTVTNLTSNTTYSYGVYSWVVTCTDAYNSTGMSPRLLTILDFDVSVSLCSGVTLYFAPNWTYFNRTTGKLNQPETLANNTAAAHCSMNVTNYGTRTAEMKFNATQSSTFLVRLYGILLNSTLQPIFNVSAGTSKLVNMTGQYVNATSGVTLKYNWTATGVG